MKIYLEYQNNPVNDFTELINKYNLFEFNSPRRSTVPLLVFWKDIQNRIVDLFPMMNLNKPNYVTACFEYKTPVQKGRGKASFTDLMLISDDQAIAVEAKYTEPPYEKVKDWLDKPPSQNRQDVLSGWVELIQKTIGRDINEHCIKDMPYQMIHCTASACYPEGMNRAVIYQYFGNDGHIAGYYKNELIKMCKLVGVTDKVKFYLFICPLIKTDRYKELEKRWDNGERNLGKEIRTGLLSNELLDFGRSSLLPI